MFNFFVRDGLEAGENWKILTYYCHYIQQKKQVLQVIYCAKQSSIQKTNSRLQKGDIHMLCQLIHNKITIVVKKIINTRMLAYAAMFSAVLLSRSPDVAD